MTFLNSGLNLGQGEANSLPDPSPTTGPSHKGACHMRLRRPTSVSLALKDDLVAEFPSQHG